MAALSLAVLFPAILALIFLIVQAGIYYHTQQWAEAAADRAVVRASEIGGTDATGESAGYELLAGSICNNPAVVPVARTEAEVTFTVSCDVAGPLASWVPDASASSTAPVERFIPETERD